MLSEKPRLRDHLAPGQFAVGQRAGMEAMKHAIDADLHEGAAEAFLSGDARNAFNSTRRSAMLRAAALVSPPLAFAMIAAFALYERPTE